MKDNVFMQGVFLIETVINKNFSKDQLVVYKQLLEDVPEHKFIMGINKLLRERVYTNIPSPAEIREYCLGTEKEIEHLSIKAGILLREALRKYRSGRVKYIFEDPIVHHIVASFGGIKSLAQRNLQDVEKIITYEIPKIYKMFYKENLKEIPELIIGPSHEELSIINIGNIEKIKTWQNEYLCINN